ncbi:MAG TPA: hypothetical protein V6D34_13740 [Candidatus Sericytochromatia bacterium]
MTVFFVAPADSQVWLTTGVLAPTAWVRLLVRRCFQWLSWQRMVRLAWDYGRRCVSQ